MELQVTSKEERPLLKRTEILARASFEGPTPARRIVLEALAKATKTKAELIILRGIAPVYGGLAANIAAYVYHDRASLEQLEHPASVKKSTMSEKAAQPKDGDDTQPPPAAKEEPKEEQPAEKGDG